MQAMRMMPKRKFLNLLKGNSEIVTKIHRLHLFSLAVEMEKERSSSA